MRKHMPLLIALLMIFVSVARATIFGNVRGIVHDPQHRPVAGAEVKLKSASSDWSRRSQTDQEGQFALTAVLLGDYIVTVSLQGFERSTASVTIVADSSPVLHFQLKIASVNQTAVVTAESEQAVANVDSVTPTTIVDRQDIQQTPGASRSNSLQMITDYVPGAYVTHDMLHVRGGHQVDWLIDGVPIPNTNIASNLGPQIDPKDIDYLEVQRGSYQADQGDRTYGVFNVVPRTGLERNNEGEVIASGGSYGQTNDYLSVASHTDNLAYYVSANGNRSGLGIETPVAQIIHDAEDGYGGFGTVI